MKCLEYEISAGVDSIKWTDRKFIPEQLAFIRWTGNNKTFFGEWWLVFWEFEGWIAENYNTAKFESVLHNSELRGDNFLRTLQEIILQIFCVPGKISV